VVFALGCVCGAGTVTGIKAVCTHHVNVDSKSDMQGAVISAILLDAGSQGSQWGGGCGNGCIESAGDVIDG
jgi:hypothetical protein